MAIIAFMYVITIKKDSSIYTYFIFLVSSLILFYVLINLIFIKSKKIKGIYIDCDNYEMLWNIVRSLTDKFKGVKIHNIIITDECKVDIVTQKRFGVWGRKRASLVIGLPILLGYSEKEVELAIAFAICKSSKHHKRKNRKIRNTYLFLEYMFNDDKALIKTNKVFDFFMKPILKGFYIFYKEVSVLIIRENYIETDEILIREYTKEEIANMILKNYVHRYLVENIFIKKVNKTLEEDGMPPENIFTIMNEYLNENISGRNIIEALKVMKNCDRDTLLFMGTSLNRIELINYKIENFQYEFGDNAARILGKSFEKIIKKFNSVWYKEKKKLWNTLSKKIIGEKEVYEKLVIAFSAYQLEEKDFKTYMDLRVKFAGINTAIVEGKKLCLAYPSNAEIRSIVGKLLLSGDNSQGIDYIESAVKLNPFVGVESYKDIINYYIRKENYETASKYEKEYTRMKFQCKQGIKERERPKIHESSFTKLDLDKENLMNIKECLGKKKYVNYAYISKLKLCTFKNIPHYILWVKFNLNFFTMEETLRSKDKEIKSDIGINNLTVIHLNGDNFYMKVLLRNIKKCKIFSRLR
ncbi:hypothetical protein [Clostridium cylindrosporum]|nr:hypothetical protein [Clostridium cylindrosporum]